MTLQIFVLNLCYLQLHIGRLSIDISHHVLIHGDECGGVRQDEQKPFWLRMTVQWILEYKFS